MVALACRQDTDVREHGIAERTIHTTRFGEITIDPAQVIYLPEGLLGFEAVHDYCLLPHAPDSPFFWLQAITVPDLAFIVVNPFDYFTEYDVEIPDADVEYLGLRSVEDVVILTIITIAGGEVTANLAGPLAIHRQTHLATQLVLADPRYGTRHSLLTELDTAR